ncbi:efflux RND transporter permease subunit [Maridesulfovibrio sp.]|uniref:efflux RND transporter permease subunit n=1 Tax=Maridesulfovibrio sp. TaxID=2795000 RepID=UPI0039EEBAD4
MTERSYSFFSALGEFLVKRRWICFLLVIVLSASAVLLSQGLKFNGSLKVWFVEDDPAMQRLEDFKREFGNDHFVYLLAEPAEGGDVFTPETITLLRDLANELEAEVPHLKDMNWVGNAETVDPMVGGIKIVRLFDEDVPEDDGEMHQRRDRALAEKDFVGRFISPGGDVAGILLEMNAYPEGTANPESMVAYTVYSILKKDKYSKLKTWVVGEPAFMFNYNVLAGKETPMLFGLCILVQLILLALLTRSFRSSVAPLLVVVLSVMWTFGIIGLIGFDLNLLIIGLPVILVCVGIGDAVHVIVAFNTEYRAGVPRKEALKNAIAKVALPCLLTTATTAAGFFSFITAPMEPFREMALYVPGGVFAALILTFLLVPFIFSFGREHPRKMVENIVERKSDVFEKIFAKIADLVLSAPKKVSVFFTVMGLMGLIGAFYVQIETNNTHLLTKEVPMRQAIEHVDSSMGGSMAIEVILDTETPDGAKKVEFLKYMQDLEQIIEKNPLVADTTSVLDALRKVRRAMHGGDEAYYALPENDKAASEYLFLYEMSGGDQLDKMLSFDGSVARINVRTSALGTREARQLREEILAEAAKFIPKNVKVETTGSVDLSVALTDNIALGQNTSFAMAFIAITIMMILSMRSIKVGVLSMVPNVFPVLMVMGLLGAAGIFMDTVVMSVSAMIIGVAVDDTIHFFIRLRREFESSGKYESAVRATIMGAGRPLLFTTLALSLGFATLMFSVMTGWIKVGALAGYAFSCALLADLFFAPALVLIFKPFGPEKEEG